MPQRVPDMFGALYEAQGGCLDQLQATAISVLCVEDDPDIRVILAMALGLDTAMTVRMCSCGVDALSLWDDGYRPDVALIDANMPGLSGLELMSRLRDRAPRNAPVIVFITASVRVHEVSGFKHAGAAAVIPKPFDPIDLAIAIRRIVADRTDR